MDSTRPESSLKKARLIHQLPSCKVDYTDAGLSKAARSALEAAVAAALTT